jgi:glucose uptake protein GlcU
VPEDVVTGFWLWVTALPLMVVGYVVAVVSVPGTTPAWLVNATTAVFAVNTAAIVVAFLLLMRQGYRWARTALTGGGAASVAFVCSNLLRSDARPAVAIAFAVAAIVGSVLIVGGIFVLHRKDAHDYFVR